MNGLTGKKKIRGARRKMTGFISRLMSETERFPEEDRPGCGYWHLHMPVSKLFIDSTSTPLSTRHVFIQAVLDAAGKLRDLKSTDEKRKIRIVTSISLPCLFDSQITVFFDDKYFSTFFDRDSSEQRWTALPANRDLQKELSLKMPEGLQQKGFHESVSDEDYSFEGEVWFFGELA
ncbi:DUF3916 domain-containing protein [Geomonas oryzisoli]|uniref:DUF3916 domain-containing protein n=1 Tax=Geomonas oryzisoli TaxID=2847992 RepID=A0ABX8JA84_9BACT|nr:DUF3916 domain-containing protein [Geomonas oryzisoli]QWV94292.1 DUF3916 domain-containing protein [Geomonas oryzisoli]